MEDCRVSLYIDRLRDLFGDDIANPAHEPIRFNYQLKLLERIIQMEEKNNASESGTEENREGESQAGEQEASSTEE